MRWRHQGADASLLPRDSQRLAARPLRDRRVFGRRFACPGGRVRPRTRGPGRAARAPGLPPSIWWSFRGEHGALGTEAGAQAVSRQQARWTDSRLADGAFEVAAEDDPSDGPTLDPVVPGCIRHPNDARQCGLSPRAFLREEPSHSRIGRSRFCRGPRARWIHGLV